MSVKKLKRKDSI